MINQTTTDTLLSEILDVLRDTDEQYPDEELEYLATVTYNRAVDAFVAEDEAHCRRLGDVASELAGFMGDGGRLQGTIGRNLCEMLGKGDG